MIGGLVERARDVERQAVIEDHPVPELRLQRGVGVLVDGAQVVAERDVAMWKALEA